MIDATDSESGVRVGGWVVGVIVATVIGCKAIRNGNCRVHVCLCRGPGGWGAARGRASLPHGCCTRARDQPPCRLRCNTWPWVLPWLPPMAGGGEGDREGA